MLNWMRSTDCVSSFLEWHTENPETPSWTWDDFDGKGPIHQTMNWDAIQHNSVCCDNCGIGGGNVDVYYWPVSSANSDCLTIVGTDLHSIDDGLWETDIRDHLDYKSQPNPYATTLNAPASLSPRLVPRLAIPAHASLSANHSIIAVLEGHTL